MKKLLIMMDNIKKTNFNLNSLQFVNCGGFSTIFVIEKQVSNQSKPKLVALKLMLEDEKKTAQLEFEQMRLACSLLHQSANPALELYGFYNLISKSNPKVKYSIIEMEQVDFSLR